MNTSTSLAWFLDADHARLNELWRECRALWTSHPARAHDVFRQFKVGLERHIAWEDDLVFPAYERHAGRPPDSLTALLTWEHRFLKQYLDRVARALDVKRSSLPLEWFVFEGLLTGHNRREEQRVYPLIEQTLDRAEERALLDAMRSAAVSIPEDRRAQASTRTRNDDDLGKTRAG